MWLASSLARPEGRRIAPFVQSLLKLTGRAVGVPATVASLLTGLGLAFVGGFSWARSIWLVASTALFAIAGAVWHWGLIPLRVKMGAMAEADRNNAVRAGAGEGEALGGGGGGRAAGVSAAYGRLAQRWLSVNGVILLLLGAILALMVWKPTLP